MYRIDLATRLSILIAAILIILSVGAIGFLVENEWQDKYTYCHGILRVPVKDRNGVLLCAVPGDLVK